GPKSPTGMLVKAIGNNSYGKTAERGEPMRVVMAGECPGPRYIPYRSEDPSFDFFWAIPDDNPVRVYHRPQIAAFITAHVRMVLYNGAMLSPEAFVKADTDSLTFSKPVGLPLDPAQYGMWKAEHLGDEIINLGKKCYMYVDSPVNKIVAKGLHVKQLTRADFEAWYAGTPPVQMQYQLVSVTRHGFAGEQFVARSRSGTRFG
ncbi:MAG: hypothetical protein ACREQ5_13050, partial [Candidatus Dormibacteria bacterium]